MSTLCTFWDGMILYRTESVHFVVLSLEYSSWTFELRLTYPEPLRPSPRRRKLRYETLILGSRVLGL